MNIQRKTASSRAAISLVGTPLIAGATAAFAGQNDGMSFREFRQQNPDIDRHATRTAFRETFGASQSEQAQLIPRAVAHRLLMWQSLPHKIGVDQRGETVTSDANGVRGSNFLRPLNPNTKAAVFLNCTAPELQIDSGNRFQVTAGDKQVGGITIISND